MKIGYFADGPWSHEALKKLEKLDSVEIVFITPRFDTKDKFLKDWAATNNVPYIKEKNVNSKFFINKIKKYKPDLNVSMSFNQILKKNIIHSAKKGFINCHAGALPFYRGRNPLNWVLINGEKSFGITVHFIDEGIDTGDIIEQIKFKITDEDNYSTLLNKAIYECANLLVKSIKKIESNNFSTISQKTIDEKGSYYSMRKKGDEIINWEKSSLECFNFIRAISDPGPYARTYCDDIEYAIVSANKSNFKKENNLIPGEIVRNKKNGIIVKTGKGSIEINKIAKVNKKGEIDKIFCPNFEIGSFFKKNK